MKRFLWFAFASIPSSFVATTKTDHKFIRKKRNLGTRQKKPGLRGENLQKNDGPGHKTKGDVARPCQYKSLQVQVVALRF